MLKGMMTTKTNFDLSLDKMNSEAYHFYNNTYYTVKTCLMCNNVKLNV